MNKSELIEVVTEKLGDRRSASTAVEAVVDAITRAVAKGEKVGITGFGVFEKVDRAARTARNPATGAAVKLKKTSVPKFRPGQGFKDIVSGAKKVSAGSNGRAVTARAGNAAKAPAKAAAKAPAKAAAKAPAKAPAKAAAKAPVKAAAKPMNEPALNKAAPAKTARSDAGSARTAGSSAPQSANKTVSKAPAAKKAPAKKAARP
ncbi:MAG: HU family DNA-binding protein [Mycobacteriales bacterium]